MMYVWNYKQYGQLVIAFNIPTQWRSREEGKWGHVPQGAVLDGASTCLIQQFKNAILSRNLNQKKPKNAFFEKKSLENRRSVWGSASQPPLTLGGRELRPQTFLFKKKHF